MLTGFLIFVVDWILIGALIDLFEVYRHYMGSKYFKNESFIDNCFMILASPYVFMIVCVLIIKDIITGECI